ncbi:putative ribonuclease H protein [Glycine max]|nr:putative ribonuclease H protein [Glycine max]
MTLLTVLTSNINDAFNQPTLLFVKWNHPPPSVIKINVDDSSFGNPEDSGFGGLLKDHLGTSNMTGELFDIYYGIKLVRELGYPVVICESDSKMTLQFIKDGVANHHPHASGIHAIRGLQQLTWYVSFQHTIREGNYAVDALAK